MIALVGAALIVIVTERVIESNEPAGDGAGTTAQLADAPPTLHPHRRSSWIAEANAVCRLGRQLYPSIALGAGADPDTMDYAVHRLVEEIAAIPVAAATPGRVRRLAPRGRAAASAWRTLATRPLRDVTLHSRRQAGRLTARYVDELVAAGARACAPLRPATPAA